jgi:hypothetical protein
MSELFKDVESESISLEKEVSKIKDKDKDKDIRLSPSIISDNIGDIPELNLLANSEKIVNNNSIIASEPSFLSDGGTDSYVTSDASLTSGSSNKTSTSSLNYNNNNKNKKKKDYSSELAPLKTKLKQSRKENKNDTIFKEKSQFLFDISQMNKDYQWSTVKYSIDNTLEDIKAEFLRIKKEKQLKLQVQMFQQMLVMGVKGVELANSYFNPLNIDLDGWSESMQYAVADHSYQDVLRELAEKYKGVGNVSPEIKLLSLIVFSGVTHVGLKKMQTMFQAPAPAPAPTQQQYQQQYQRNYSVDSSVSESRIPKPDDLAFSDKAIDEVMKKMKQKEQIVEIPIVKKRGRPKQKL